MKSEKSREEGSTFAIAIVIAIVMPRLVIRVYKQATIAQQIATVRRNATSCGPRFSRKNTHLLTAVALCY